MAVCANTFVDFDGRISGIENWLAATCMSPIQALVQVELVLVSRHCLHRAGCVLFDIPFRAEQPDQRHLMLKRSLPDDRAWVMEMEQLVADQDFRTRRRHPIYRN